MPAAWRIRPFDPADLPAVAALYDRALAPHEPRYSYPLTDVRLRRLERQYFGSPEFRPDGLFVAEADDAVVGFVFGAVRLRKITPDDELPGVFVCLLLVDEPYRRRGIGTALMERVAEFGRRHGKALLSAHANPMNPLAFWPGVNRRWGDIVGFLRAHGFEAHETEVSMDQRVDGFGISDYAAARRAQAMADGFELVRYSPRWHDALLAASGTPFWHLDLQSKIDQVEPPFIETAFLDLDRDSIYGPDDVTLLVRGDELAGFVAMCRNPGETVSYLGPIRIVDRYQGAGLGSVMIQQCLMWERERGMQVVDLWCSQENARRFYSRNGFTQHDAWDLYERPL